MLLRTDTAKVVPHERIRTEYWIRPGITPRLRQSVAPPETVAAPFRRRVRDRYLRTYADRKSIELRLGRNLFETTVAEGRYYYAYITWCRRSCVNLLTQILLFTTCKLSHGGVRFACVKTQDARKVPHGPCWMMRMIRLYLFTWGVGCIKYLPIWPSL